MGINLRHVDRSPIHCANWMPFSIVLFNNNNNDNNNSHANVYGAVVMTRVIARVHPVYLMNVDWAPGGRQLSDQATNDLGCESAENWQLPSTSTISIVIITQPVGWYSFYRSTSLCSASYLGCQQDTARICCWAPSPILSIDISCPPALSSKPAACRCCCQSRPVFPDPGYAILHRRQWIADSMHRVTVT